MQDKFIFFPQKDPLNPTQYGLEQFEPLMLTTQDNIDIATWWHPPLAHYPTIIYFHGNAGHIGFRAEKLRLMQEAGYGVLALSYRGYGASQGEPGELGMYEDARTAVAFAVSELGIPVERIILYGESLGSGVAVNTASIIEDIGMVVLEAPYTSVIERGMERFPFLPVRWLLRSRFNSLGRLHHFPHTPVLILHGEKDNVIPVAHGRKMLEAVEGPKQGIFFPEVNHNDFDPRKILEAITQFARTQGMLR